MLRLLRTKNFELTGYENVFQNVTEVMNSQYCCVTAYLPVFLDIVFLLSATKVKMPTSLSVNKERLWVYLRYKDTEIR